MQPTVDDMHAEMHAYCVMIYTLRVVIYTARRDDIQRGALIYPQGGGLSPADFMVRIQQCGREYATCG